MHFSYTAADALVYIRELFASHVDLIHDQLLEHYGQIEDDGETYLPPFLASLINDYYLLGYEITDKTVEVGPNRRDSSGQLWITKQYSTGQPVYATKHVNTTSQPCIETFLIPPKHSEYAPSTGADDVGPCCFPRGPQQPRGWRR